MRMGFNDQEIVALSGAHNLGRCHTNRSGFDGKWVHSSTQFSNQYFRLLMRLERKPKKLENGVLRFAHVGEDLGEELMMLPTDMAPLTDKIRLRTEWWSTRYQKFSVLTVPVFHPRQTAPTAILRKYMPAAATDR